MASDLEDFADSLLIEGRVYNEHDQELFQERTGTASQSDLNSIESRTTTVETNLNTVTNDLSTVTADLDSLEETVNGIQVGDSYRVPNLADLPSTPNSTPATIYGSVYADSVSSDNNGRYYKEPGSSTWVKVPGDLTGRVSDLEEFRASAETVLPTKDDYPGIIWILDDPNGRPLLRFDSAAKAYLKLADGSLTTSVYADASITRAKLATDVSSVFPTLDDFNNAIWILDDPNGRPLIYFDAEGKAHLRFADSSISGNTLTDGSITSFKIASGAIGYTHLDISLQSSFPDKDDYSDLIWILDDPNGRPLMRFKSDGTLLAKIAGTEDSAQMRTDINNLKGWYWGLETLTNTNLRLSRIKAGKTERLNIINHGDSWTDAPYRFGEPFSNLMQAEYGGVGVGYVGLSYFQDSGGITGGSNRNKVHGSTDPANWTRGRTGTNAVYSPDGCDMHSFILGAWIEVYVYVPQPSPKLYYRQLPGGGTFRWQLNGGAWTTVDTNGVDSLQSVTITIPFTYPHTIRIEVMSGSTAGVWIGAMDFTSPTGVVVHKWARSGSQAVEFANQINLQYYQQWVSALNPHLMTFLWSTNEQANNCTPGLMIESILAIITRVKDTHPLCDFLIMCPAQTALELGGYQYAIRQYRDALRDLAIQERVAFIDLVEVFGEYSKYKYSADGSTLNFYLTDNIHPDQNTGALVIASSVYKAVTKLI